jgi:hypothetical protein
MENDKKFGLNKLIQATQVLANGIDISDEAKVRFVIEGAAGGNTVVVKGKITGEDTFSTTLATLSGSINQVVNVATYDQIYVECTVYASSGSYVKVIASSFNDAGGSAIDQIGVITGTNLTDFSEFTFTSSDNSVEIEGNNTTKEIDFRAVGGGGNSSYVDTFDDSADWGAASGGNYSITIAQLTHGKGVSPKVQVFELVGATYELVYLNTIVSAAGNVTISVNETPDLRFEGKIIIF